jgi:hypothetical protein
MNELTITVPAPVYERISEQARRTAQPVNKIVIQSLQAVFLPESTPIPDDVPSVVARIQHWLAQQSPSTVRPPIPLPEAERRDLDREFEELLSAIHERNRSIPFEEVMQDVEKARRQARNGR